MIGKIIRNYKKETRRYLKIWKWGRLKIYILFSMATIHDHLAQYSFSDFPPYFTNTANTATATDNRTLYPVGTAVFPLTVTDADPDDVNSLMVTMTTSSTYFELNTTTCE